MNIKPLFDNVLLERSEALQKTQSGLYIPSSATEKPNQGRVIAVGSGKKLNDGSVKAPTVQLNDTVVFRNYDATELKFEGETYLLIQEKNILGIVR
ncbi:MAG: co-chaperone GroES [Proteobacteria bacterium]|nr:co-chaperone GroES [Pseudomonadota bacterium]